MPPLLANAVGERGTTLLTQPRRVAVRAAARRIASLDGSEVGSAVGFTVRGERRVSGETRIEALTPGVLLRRLIDDPELTGVSAVVLDEVHERSVDGDLLLGLLAEVRELRDDLVVVAMSATLDAHATAELLGDARGPAPVVNVPAPLHPLTIDYAPFGGSRLDERGATRDYLAHLAGVTLEAQRSAGQEHSARDALVFVPGAREVDEVTRLLRSQAAGLPDPPEVLPLHGRLSARDQDRAVRGRLEGEPPRIVVSTALAESSLTVPGVSLVIDGGLAREVRRDRARDMSGLVTVSTSRSSATQRAGRAARQGPGRAVRVYSEADFARMPPSSTPEILSADLTDMFLLLAAWGTPAGTGLTLPTRPPAAAAEAATHALRALELIDDSGSATALGQRVAHLPVGAREARALLDGAAAPGHAHATAEVVAALSDTYQRSDADISGLLRELRTGRIPGADRWRREVARLERVAAHEGAHESPQPGNRIPADPASPPAGEIIALARPEWVARRTGPRSRSYLLASGTRAALPEGSPLQHHEWIAVHEVQRASSRAADGTGAVIRLAGALSEDSALTIGAHLITEERLATIESGRVRVRGERRLGAITLSSVPLQATRKDTSPAFEAHLQQKGLAALDFSDTAVALRSRLAFLHREIGDPWPAVDDASLLARLDDWLGHDLATLKPDSSLKRIDVTHALRRLLPWPEASRLDELAPERLPMPSGNSARVSYQEEFPRSSTDDDDADLRRPVISVKLQEVFGLAETPRLAGGRSPVLFHLLSPARRPLAVTGDLASFWGEPYQQVRKEMRGRYPKHPWPEDPWSAKATARTKHRSD